MAGSEERVMVTSNEMIDVDIQTYLRPFFFYGDIDRTRVSMLRKMIDFVYDEAETPVDAERSTHSAETQNLTSTKNLCPVSSSSRGALTNTEAKR